MVAAPQPARAEQIGEPIGPFVEFAIGQDLAGPTIDQGRVSRPRLGMIGNVHHRPPSSATVLPVRRATAPGSVPRCVAANHPVRSPTPASTAPACTVFSHRHEARNRRYRRANRYCLLRIAQQIPQHADPQHAANPPVPRYRVPRPLAPDALGASSGSRSRSWLFPQPPPISCPRNGIRGRSIPVPTAKPDTPQRCTISFPGSGALPIWLIQLISFSNGTGSPFGRYDIRGSPRNRKPS